MKRFTMPNQAGWLLSKDGSSPCFHDMTTVLPTRPGWKIQMCFAMEPLRDADEATRQPHPCWIQGKSDRHPADADGWDWTKDTDKDQADGAKTRSEKRLAVAGDYADPRAPNQMALVLRMDLIRLLGDLQWHRARGNLFFEKGETPAIDLAYSQINALGGTVTDADLHGKGYCQAVDDVLTILTKLGAKDAPYAALVESVKG